MFCIRSITPVTISDAEYKRPAAEVLQNISAVKMAGLLTQIAELSSQASDIFGDLIKDASATTQRVKALSGRIQNVESKLPIIEQMFQSHRPSDFYHRSDVTSFQRNDTLTSSLFIADNQPEPIAQLRAQAAEPPRLSDFDALGLDPDGPSAKTKYSNPNLFIEYWTREQAELLAAQEEERKAKKAARREKRKKKKKTEKRQKRVVQAIQVKRYNAFGAEFNEPAHLETKDSKHVQRRSAADEFEYVEPTVLTPDMQQQYTPAQPKSSPPVVSPQPVSSSHVPSGPAPSGSPVPPGGPPTGPPPSGSPPSGLMPTGPPPGRVGPPLGPPGGPPPKAPLGPPGGPPPSGSPPAGPPPTGPPPTGPPPTGRPPTGPPPSSSPSSSIPIAPPPSSSSIPIAPSPGGIPGAPSIPSAPIPSAGIPSIPSPGIPSAPGIAPSPSIPSAPGVPSAPSIPSIPSPPMPGAGSIPSIPSPPIPSVSGTPQRRAGPPSGSPGRGSLLAAIQKGKKLRSAGSRPVAPKPADGRSDLLAAIRGGAKLKKAAPIEKPKPSGRGGLLMDIKKGFQLRKAADRKVEQKEESTKKNVPAGMSAVMGILARRAAIEGSSDEDSDDDW